MVDKGNGSYIHISGNQRTNVKVKKLAGFTTVNTMYLGEKEIDNLFQNCMLVDS